MFQEGTNAVTFNTAFYLQQNPDVRLAIQNGTFQGTALQHFIDFGADENRAPNQFFDADYYLAQNPDVLVALGTPGSGIESAFDHFVRFGQFEGEVRAPSAAFASFNAESYLAQNPDLQAAFANVPAADLDETLFNHFLTFGVNENRPGSGVNVDSGTIGQTFTLTGGVDELTGTAGNDTFVAPISTNAFGQPVQTLTEIDVLNGGAGNDTLIATIGDDVTPVLSNIENVQIRSIATSATVNLANATGVETLTSAGTLGDLTFSNIGDVDVFTVRNTKGDTTFDGGTATAATLTVENVGTAAAASVVDFDDNALKSVTLNATNSNAAVTYSGTALTTLNLVATGANAVTIESSTVTTATVSGSGSVELTDGFAALKSFDASSNKGGVDADFSAVTGNVTVTGGSGADRFDFGGNLTKTDVVNGGAGFDTVVVSSTDVTSATAAAPFNALTNIERVEFNGTSSAVDGATFTNASITNILFNTAGADVITGAGSTRTYEFGTSNGDDATFTMKDGQTTLNLALLGEERADDTGAAIDDLSVALASGAAATAVSTINIASLGDLDAAATNAIATLTARGGSTIVITGEADLDIGGLTAASGAGSTAGFTVNASAFAGDLTIASSANADTITLGSGQDRIEFAAGTSGDLSTTANPTIINFDVVLGFTAGAGGDVLDFVTGGTTVDYTAINAATQTQINDSAVTLADAFEFAAATLVDTGGVAVAGWTAFDFNGQTFAAYSDGLDNGSAPAAGADFGAGDLLVRLQGVNIADLVDANFA